VNARVGPIAFDKQIKAKKFCAAKSMTLPKHKNLPCLSLDVSARLSWR
jgi:hypothetical protein